MKTHEDILTHQSLARISARARVLGIGLQNRRPKARRRRHAMS